MKEIHNFVGDIDKLQKYIGFSIYPRIPIPL